MARPVRLWRCTRCGVETKGVEATDGHVYATDRPLTDPQAAPAPCLCGSCAGWQARLHPTSWAVR